MAFAAFTHYFCGEFGTQPKGCITRDFHLFCKNRKLPYWMLVFQQVSTLVLVWICPHNALKIGKPVLHSLHAMLRLWDTKCSEIQVHVRMKYTHDFLIHTTTYLSAFKRITIRMNMPNRTACMRMLNIPMLLLYETMCKNQTTRMSHLRKYLFKGSPIITNTTNNGDKRTSQ